MKRYSFSKILVEHVQDELIVSTVAPTNHELFSVKDLPTSFYMRHSLGMASSIGLGLALARPDRKVIVLEGDGGILMNLGSLATIATQHPKNLILFILDNRCYENTGCQPTATAYRTQLDLVSKGAGIEKVYRWSDIANVESEIEQVLKEEGPTVVVVEIEKGRESKGMLDIGLVENKLRFMKAVASP
ncbi:MAG: sulfopyruvate decarboxylase subunit beta [Deltaproteobacteria bacterium]|nr:sulfopyruvate decarboxylase subunit beta [Deltaproteobacteria bacterium]